MARVAARIGPIDVYPAAHAWRAMSVRWGSATSLAGMATRTVEKVLDDLDGTELSSAVAERVALSLDGEAYELDLSPRNARALRDALEPYIRAAHRAHAERERSEYRVTNLARAVPLAEVRRWAAANGYDFAARGAVPKHVREAYDAAH